MHINLISNLPGLQVHCYRTVTIWSRGQSQSVNIKRECLLPRKM